MFRRVVSCVLADMIAFLSPLAGAVSAQAPTWERGYPQRGASGCVEYIAQWSDGTYTSTPWDCGPGQVAVGANGVIASRGYPQQAPNGCTEYVTQWSDDTYTWVPFSCPEGVQYVKPGTAAPTAPAAPPLPAAPPSGRVLLQDNFDNPARGILAESSASPNNFTLGYENGEYLVRKIDPNFKSAVGSTMPGTFKDVAIAVDARIVGDATNRFVIVMCRLQPTSEASYYGFAVKPSMGEAWLIRTISGNQQITAPIQSAAIRRDSQVNRIELSCVGNRMIGRVNGTTLAEQQWTTWQEGELFIGAVADDPPGTLVGTFEARFDNLIVTQG